MNTTVGGKHSSAAAVSREAARGRPSGRAAVDDADPGAAGAAPFPVPRLAIAEAGRRAPFRPGAGQNVASAAARRSTRLSGSGVWLMFGIVFLAGIAVVGPRGEFPLNDDWSFAATARRLFLDHDWRPLGWASMTQVTQALLGSVVCAVSSCSFEHLRLGTLLVGFLLLPTTAALLVMGGASRTSAILGAMATVFNPVIYPLFYTFMTDVPFQLAIVLAAMACVAALRLGRWRDVVLATGLICVATMSRQIGLVVAAAFLPVFWLTSPDAPLRRIAKAAAPLAVCCSVLVAYETWMRHAGRLPKLYDDRYRAIAIAASMPLETLSQIALGLVISLMYLGAICLPMLVFGPAMGWSGRHRRTATRHAWGVTAAAAALMFVHREMMPLLGNVLNRGGNGPLTLRDVYILRRPDVPSLPDAFWLVVTGLCLLGLWLLVRHVVALSLEACDSARLGRLAPLAATKLFAVLATVLYLLPVLSGALFDRYLAVIAPILCLALGGSRPSAGSRSAAARTALAGSYTAAVALFSVLACHDYLAWNRARWAAISAIEGSQEGDERTVDGGLEYNGDRSYQPGYAAVPGKSWWWVADDRLQLSFAPLPGTEIVRSFPYPNYLPVATRSIYLLRRVDEPDGRPPSTPGW